MHFTTSLLALSAFPAILASPYPYQPKRGSPVQRAYPSHPTSTGVVLPPGPYCPPKPASEAVQRAIFDEFIQTLYIEKNVTAAFENFIAVDLIERMSIPIPMIPTPDLPLSKSGIGITTNTIADDPFDAQGRAANEAKLIHIIPFVPSTVLAHAFENDHGFIQVRVDEEGHLPIALADIYRLNGTCLVEHWDITQETPRNATNTAVPFT